MTEKGTRGVASSEVPGGSRVSAERDRDPEVRTERFLRYIDGILPALSSDNRGRVTEVLYRALLESHRTISRGEAEVLREALGFGVEILMRKPELLAQLLADSGAYEWDGVHYLPCECPTDEVRDPCSRILAPTVPPRSTAAAERDP